MEKSKADIYYERHLARMRKYNQENKDKMRDRAREYFKQIKADPERYKLYLEQKREKYKEQNPKPILPVKEF
jgi:DNA-binding transcriptional MocR family regulator